jgi:hypothetical protein
MDRWAFQVRGAHPFAKNAKGWGTLQIRSNEDRFRKQL